MILNFSVFIWRKTYLLCANWFYIRFHLRNLDTDSYKFPNTKNKRRRRKKKVISSPNNECMICDIRCNQDEKSIETKEMKEYKYLQRLCDSENDCFDYTDWTTVTKRKRRSSWC